jgi:hypothetical protein
MSAGGRFMRGAIRNDCVIVTRYSILCTIEAEDRYVCEDAQDAQSI